MSREIKFRAWGHLIDHEYTMHHNVSLYLFHSELLPACGNVAEPICDHNLMQYTGLKDNNGVEIYEGDIVDVAWHYEGDFEVQRHNSIVLFESGAYYGGSKYYDELDSPYINVIGNIYENPEQLEEKSLEIST